MNAVLIIAPLAVFSTLAFGPFRMASGGKLNAKLGNLLMRLRVILLFLEIGLIVTNSLIRRG